ncbi:putative LRR receptor-like serine/threonine-protein kinase, partial [Camellia lanceoleosa]
MMFTILYDCVLMWVIYYHIIESSFTNMLKNSNIEQEMVTVSEYPKSICTFMLVLFILICFGACAIEAQTRRIPPDEMAALGEIAEKLGKKDWNLNLNHCDENLNWNTPIVPTGIYNSIVNCSCPSGDECHINAIKFGNLIELTKFGYFFLPTKQSTFEIFKWIYFSLSLADVIEGTIKGDILHIVFSPRHNFFGKEKFFARAKLLSRNLIYMWVPVPSD